MTLADKLITLNSTLSSIDALLVEEEDSAMVRVYSNLYEKVNSVYIVLSEEWLEENKPK